MGIPLIDRLFRRPPNRGPLPDEPPPGLPGLSLAEAATRTGWTAARLAQADALWGEGFIWPGGADEIKRLAAPFGLSPAHSLLVLGDGAAGAARALAADLGAWISAYESDPALHQAAEAWRRRGGLALAKRATVALWDRAAPSFPVRGFHHALLLETLPPGSAAPILDALVRAVKPGGQIVLVQTVRGAGEEAEIVAALAQAGCDVRVVEDESTRHAHIVLAAWKHLLRRLRDARPAPSEAAALVQEAAIWLIRLRRLREGRLKVMRWGAIAG